MFNTKKTNEKLSRVLSKSLRPSMQPIDTARILGASYFAGGAVSSLMTKGRPNDYDLFLRDPSIALNLVRMAIGRVNKTRSLDAKIIDHTEGVRSVCVVAKKGYDLFVEMRELNQTLRSLSQSKKRRMPSNSTYFDSGRILYLTNNSVTLSGGVQVVTRFIGAPERVIQLFDYEHCKCYWEPSAFGVAGGRSTISDTAKESLLSKELVYRGGSPSLLTAVTRIQKFAERGWTISPSSALNLLLDAKKMDFEDASVLQRQLEGFYGIDSHAVASIIEQNKVGKTDRVNLDGFMEELYKIA